VHIIPITTPIIKPKDNLVDTFLSAIDKLGLQIEDGDLLAIASKAVATEQERQIKLCRVSPSRKARVLAEKYSLEADFAQLIIEEADKIFGGVKRAVLTLKDGNLTVNAGIDLKNAREGHAILWPLNTHQEAETIRSELSERTGRQIGVLIVDSDVAPLRMGTRGLALAVAGFRPVKDYRNHVDLFGRTLRITRHSMADDLASAAHALMGESDERKAFVLIKGAPVTFTRERTNPEDLLIPFENCVYGSMLKS